MTRMAAVPVPVMAGILKISVPGWPISVGKPDCEAYRPGASSIPSPLGAVGDPGWLDKVGLRWYQP